MPESNEKEFKMMKGNKNMQMLLRKLTKLDLYHKLKKNKLKNVEQLHYKIRKI